jgi:ATP-dependent exoDNAse (exonuclease V) beta subunit
MKKIKFYKKSHTYKVGKTKLKSVTQALANVFPDFDAKTIAKQIAKGFKYRNWKNGVTAPEEIAKGTMKYWLNNWKERAEHGTRVHKAMEEYINLLDPAFVLDRYCSTEEDKKKAGMGIGWLNKLLPTMNKPLLIPEYVVFNESLGYAGTIDLYILDDDGVCYLVDWKTNDNLIKPGQPLPKPLAHLDDSKMCRYALQLSFYRYMLELQGAKVNTLYLVHLQEQDVKVYECEYLKDDVKKVIEVDKNE